MFERASRWVTVLGALALVGCSAGTGAEYEGGDPTTAASHANDASALPVPPSCDPWCDEPAEAGAPDAHLDGAAPSSDAHSPPDAAGDASHASDCPAVTYPSGVVLVPKLDPALTAEYAALGAACVTPKCFLDVNDLRSPDGTVHDIHVNVGVHFTLYELVSTDVDQGWSTHVLVDPEAVRLLDKLRVDYGGPVSITSGFRSPAHQRALCQQICGSDECYDGSGAVTCARTSRHMWGSAADMDLIYENAANAAGFPFVYHEGGGTAPHLHVDMQSCH